MKRLLIKFICCISAMLCSLYCYSRTVVSKSTREPIIYANVGVINRNLGTVTDTLGNFSLNIPKEYITDTIMISCVGFIPQKFAVKDIKNIPDTILLAVDTIILSEVVVKPQRIKHKTAGRKGSGGFIFIEVEKDRAAGQGLATPLKVKNRAWLKEIGFTIVTEANYLSHMKFRVNFYRKENNSFEQMNIPPVYFDYDKSQLKDGTFSYAFPEEIMLEYGEYYIELEFLENFPTEYFAMKTRPLTGKTRFRYASQSDWETFSFGAPIYIGYDTIE